jgi:alpha galactosidase A-like protein
MIHIMRSSIRHLATGCVCLAALGGLADAAVTTNQIAVPRPAMGWASWNSFASSFDASTIRAQVDAFVAAGMPAAGYQYIDIDEGWWQGARDSAGNIMVNPTQWRTGWRAS